MGVQLYINTADFSKNCINKLKIRNYALTINDYNYGWVLTQGSQYRASSDPIFIPAGVSITITGLKGINGNSPTIIMNYCYYVSNDIPSVIASSDVSNPAVNAVGIYPTTSSTKFPLNYDNLKDEIKITNTYNTDYYFVFAIACIGTSVPVEINNYNLTWKYS